MGDLEALNLFKEPIEKRFDGKARLSQELKNLFRDGFVFLYLPDGSLMTRPEIKILENCVIYAKHFSMTGKVVNYKYVYEGVKYARLNFE